jgi:hypothetical protein
MLQQAAMIVIRSPRLQLSQLQMSGEQFQVAPNKRFTPCTPTDSRSA